MYCTRRYPQELLHYLPQKRTLNGRCVPGDTKRIFFYPNNKKLYHYFFYIKICLLLKNYHKTVQRARVHFGEPCNKRAFILAIHLLSVFWRTIKESYASMLHKVWTVSRVPRTHGMKCSSLIPLLKSVQFIESTRVFVG
jgi:hypothetical protein